MADFDLKGNSFSDQIISMKAGQVLSPANYAIFQSVATMKTYLLANGYTAAQCNAMTKNDLIYAARLKLGILPN